MRFQFVKGEVKYRLKIKGKMIVRKKWLPPGLAPADAPRIRCLSSVMATEVARTFLSSCLFGLPQKRCDRRHPTTRHRSTCQSIGLDTSHGASTPSLSARRRGRYSSSRPQQSFFIVPLWFVPKPTSLTTHCLQVFPQFPLDSRTPATCETLCTHATAPGVHGHCATQRAHTQR